MQLLFYFAIVAASVYFFGCIQASLITTSTRSQQNPLSVSSYPETATTVLDIPVQFFSVTPDLLKLIVSVDIDTGLFLLPEMPSNILLVKLVCELRLNSKQVTAITYLVKKFSHNDTASEKLLKGSFETFKTLSLLHKSMEKFELYAPVLEVMTEVIEVHINFIKIFTASLVIDRMAQIEAFKKIILDFNTLEGIFYLLSNLVPHDIQCHLIDLIFSAVDSEEEESHVWSLYTRFASPSNFVALPHEFLIFHSKVIKWKIAEDFIGILSQINLQLKAAWLSQFGLLIRFRTISTSEALLIAKTINLSLPNLIPGFDHFSNFICLAFLDDLIIAKPLGETVLNFFNSCPERTENLMNFYIILWNLIVSDLPTPLEEEEWSSFLIFAIKDLEIKFPGISEQFNSKIFNEIEEWKSIQFIRKIDEFNFDISSTENIKKVIEFIEIFVETEIKEISIKEIRFSLNLLYKKFFEIIKKLKLKNEVSEIVEIREKLKIILSQKLIKYSKFIENFKEIFDVEIFVDFAFSLPEISEAENLFHFIYAKIDGNDQLFSFFLQKFSEKFKNRQNFFFICFDRGQFVKFDLLVIQNFVESIKNCQLTDNLIQFITGAYLNGFVTQEQLFNFLESLKNGNYSNLNFDGSEFFGFLASITEVTYFEFREDSPKQTFNQFSENSQANTIKILEILSSFNDGELLDKFEIGLIPWLCNRIVAFEHLKPELSEIDQLNHFTSILNSSDLTINQSARLCTKIILQFLIFGASEKDLKITYEFIKKLRIRFMVDLLSHDKRFMAVASSFCLLVFIIRSNDSLVPIDYALDVMRHYKLKCYRISVAQSIYKAYKDPRLRAELFPSLIHYCFDRSNHGLVYDPKIFDGMSESTVDMLLKSFLNHTFYDTGVDKARIESFCYWMNMGLVSLSLAKHVVERVSEQRERSIGLKLSIVIIRAVFHQEKYATIRTLTVELLFLNAAHSAIYSPFFMTRIIRGIADLFEKPEFVLALAKPSKHSEDLHYILLSENQRRTRINSESLDLSYGIENVIENYNHALLEISSFSLSLERKTILLRSIYLNLSRISLSYGENDLISEPFALNLLDQFVRISISLAIQIQTDLVPPVQINELESRTLEIYFAAIIQFVRDSNIQALLTFDILSAIKDRPESRGPILEIIPRYMNWRRFLLIPDSFKVIFNFGGPTDIFDKFMTEIINAAFRFEDLFPTDAEDDSRPTDQILLVDESFFSSMTCLIKDFNLPAKYTLHALRLMNKYYDTIQIFSSNLFEFLRATIEIRQISPSSSCYRITSKSYGLGCVYDSQKEVVKLVLEFLEIRPDFLCVALVSERESEPFQFMIEIEYLAKNLFSFISIPMALIRSIFNYPDLGFDSLKLIPRINLPKSAIRSLVAWLSSSSSTSQETFLPIAFIMLDLIPSTFTIESFTDLKISQSWYQIASSIVEWFTKVAANFPQQFGQGIEENLIEKYFNILLWSLEFDEKEEVVSNSLSIFLDSLAFSSVQARYRAIHLFSSSYFRPLLRALASSEQALLTLSSNFRKLSEGNLELAKEVEKLIPFLFESKIELNEGDDGDSAVLYERTQFLSNLKALDSIEEFQSLREILIIICRQISRLRLMGNEHDLTLKFIEKLHKLAMKFYFQVPNEETSVLAFSLCKAMNFIWKEILLQANSKIFIDLFRFFYRHISFNTKSEDYFEAAEIIFSQIVTLKDFKCIFKILIENLRLECCLLQSKRLSKRFYKNKYLIETFASDYLLKMSKLGYEMASIGEVKLDGIHLIEIFIILNKINASEDIFRFWIKNVSGLRHNDVMTEEFAENLKSFCATRKDFIEDLAKIYINEFFITKMFEMEGGKCKENLFLFFNLVLLHNPQVFHRLVNEKLSVDLQIKMREKIGDALLEKKQKVVQDFVAKCELPENENFEISQVFGLARKLEVLLKFDLNLLSIEKFTSFFHRLGILIDELTRRDLIENSSEIINLLAVSCALQTKNGIPIRLNAIMLILSLNGVLTCNEEVLNLITKQIVKLDHDFTQIESISIVHMIQKTSDPTKILKEFLNNPRTLEYRAFIIENALETRHKSDKLEIHLILQYLLANLIKNYNQQTTQSLEQFEDLSALIRLARTHKLLGKTQILILDRLN